MAFTPYLIVNLSNTFYFYSFGYNVVNGFTVSCLVWFIWLTVNEITFGEWIGFLSKEDLRVILVTDNLFVGVDFYIEKEDLAARPWF